MIRKKRHNSQIIIDLTGPGGNAFCLMGLAKQWAQQLQYSQQEITEMLSECKTSDYEHLLETIDKHFGEFVIFER